MQMSTKSKNRANFNISGAGVISVSSSDIFESEQGKRQISALKQIHERRKSAASPQTPRKVANQAG